MLRGLAMGVVSIILIGLGVALLGAFNWDIGSLFTWAYGLVTGLIDAVAKFFTGNPTFQQVVSS